MKFLLILFFTSLHVIPSKLQACGKFSFSSGLVVNGDEAKRGEFPFLVALLKLQTQKFFCAASLITDKHALTASHCIHEKGRINALKAEDIVALLGKHSLKSQYERGMVHMEIKKIILHEDWKPYVTRYDADIAILFFEREVQFSEFIKTVCMPLSSQTKSLRMGEVVGWGSSERTHFTYAEDTPRKTQIGAPPNNEFCFLHQPGLTELSSNRTFCGGGEHTGPCVGDSGGGFYVKIDSTWYLQGIVSSSLLNNDRECDVTNYAVYTNVAFFTDWVWERINGLKSLSLPCDFDYSTNLKRQQYYCASNISITSDDFVISNVFGAHKDGKTNEDVKLLDFSPDDDDIKFDIYFIPSGIGDTFPSLRLLYIQNCKLTRLSRKNFKRMNMMSTISLSNNAIEHIDEDTFYEVPMLYSLRVNGNRLKSLSNNIFIHSPRLQHFTFDSNEFETFDGNLIFRNNPSLISIVLEDNKLKNIHINLTSLRELTKVDLRNNACINLFYGKGSTTTLQEIQNVIDKNC